MPIVAILCAAGFFNAGAASAQAPKRSSVYARADCLSHSFVLLLSNDEVLIWDADQGSASSRFPFSPKLVHACETLTIAPKDASFIPIEGGRLAVGVGQEWFVVDRKSSEIVKEFSSTGPWPPYCRAGGKTVGVFPEPLSDAGFPLENVNIVLDLGSGREIARWKAPDYRKVWKHLAGEVGVCTGPCHSSGLVAFTGLIPGLSGTEVIVWDAIRSKVLWRVTSKTCFLDVSAFSPDGKALAMVQDVKGKPAVRDARNGRLLATLDATTFEDLPYYCAFSRGGDKLLVPVAGTEAIVWDWKDSGRSRRVGPRAADVEDNEARSWFVFSSDGSRVVQLTDQFRVYEYDAETGRLISEKVISFEDSTGKPEGRCRPLRYPSC